MVIWTNQEANNTPVVWTERQTESYAYEPTVQCAQVGSKTVTITGITAGGCVWWCPSVCVFVIRGDNALGSTHPSVQSALSWLNRLSHYPCYQSGVFVCNQGAYTDNSADLFFRVFLLSQQQSLGITSQRYLSVCLLSGGMPG